MRARVPIEGPSRLRRRSGALILINFNFSLINALSRAIINSTSAGLYADIRITLTLQQVGQKYSWQDEDIEENASRGAGAERNGYAVKKLTDNWTR